MSGKVGARCTDCSCGERLKGDGPGRVREDRVRDAAPGGQQERKPGHGGVLGTVGSWARDAEADPGWKPWFPWGLALVGRVLALQARMG